jgi:hypothetical protein
MSFPSTVEETETQKARQMLEVTEPPSIRIRVQVLSTALQMSLEAGVGRKLSEEEEALEGS